MEQQDLFLKLEQHLCFTAYACSKEMTKLYRPILDEFGLTYTQYITLVVLWERRKLPMKELGARLYLDSGTLSPLLKKLEGMGLITRIRDKQDERTVLVGLTEAGTKLKDKVKNIPLRLFDQSDVSEEKLLQIHTQMNDLLNMLEELNPKKD
ncbi:MarR family transcriptional regulator [Paenibacillus sp. MAHUQ-46]|uniref:MarR family transcriptional regulator n=2 Tax=Paenibacillus TaxID=44249 RepID=A0A934MSF4_9BACL|nr:MarR family transcriptional regulator [Paenibacillus roseus]MBJ6363878.1 MarR family transcriptional regulator [Paenibacillus roseus]